MTNIQIFQSPEFGDMCATDQNSQDSANIPPEAGGQFPDGYFETIVALGGAS